MRKWRWVIAAVAAVAAIGLLIYEEDRRTQAREAACVPADAIQMGAMWSDKLSCAEWRHTVIGYYCQYGAVSAFQERGCEQNVTVDEIAHRADNNSNAALCALGLIDGCWPEVDG